MSIMVLPWLLPTILAASFLLLATREAPPVKPRTYAEAAAGLLIASLAFIVVTPFTIYTQVLLMVLQLAAVLLAARLIFGRLNKAFSYPSTQANILVIVAVQAVVVGLWWLGSQFPGLLGGYDWRLVALLCVALAVHMLFLAQVVWSFMHYRIKLDEPQRRLGELPTVSVCIPARNEDHALEDCLLSVLASSYPKLEVLVLDDCSQDKTSELIRSFAHDGVRFIQGDTPTSGWLGKNRAMQTLAEHASGDYFLFLDVDTRLSVTSITQLVDYILDNKMEMVTVLPQNRLGLQPGALLGTLRYYWQMALPLTKRRVPVASQAWLINADRLRDLGGFKSVARKIVPEGSFARRLFTKDTYRFIAGNEALGITTAKRWPSELASAIRVLYPTYKRQPLVALGAIAWILGIILAPILLCIVLLVQGEWNTLTAMAAVVAASTFITYGLAVERMRPRAWPLTTLLLPLAAIQEIFLIITSLLQYEFGEVNWKGRNVCYPVISSAQNPAVPKVSPSHH